MTKINRRKFLLSTAAASLATSVKAAPAIHTGRSKPVVLASRNGFTILNGGSKSCVETAFDQMLGGADVLDALIAGVNIVELDPEAFYARFDRNKDRKIAREELPPSRLRDAFNFTDTDHSGFFEFEEFAPRFEPADPSSTPGRNVFVSVAAGGEGDITETHVTWEKRNNLPYVCSPLLYKNRLYLVKKGGTVSCLNPQTGEAHFERGRLGAYGEYYASPIGVDDKIIIASEPGSITILRASDDLEILSSRDMGEAVVASPAIVDNHLYIRTANHLWAF